MKKISLSVLAFITGMAIYAQNTDMVTPMAIKTRFGVKAGVNLAKLRPHHFGTSQPETNLKTSFHAGALVNIPMGTGGFAIQPEVLFSGQGSKMDMQTTVGGVTTTSKVEQDLSYIAVPVMLQWKSSGGFYVETGPQIAFLMSAQQEGPGDTETDNKDAFNSTDFSWGGGLGFLSRIGLGVGARYNHSISNALEEDDFTGTGEPPELQHSVIQIGLFWHFGAGK